MTDTLRALIAKREEIIDREASLEATRLACLGVVDSAHCYKTAALIWADELEAALATSAPQLRHWRTCEDCGGLLVYDKDDVDAALAAEPQKNGGLTTSEIEAIVDNAFADAAECPDPWAGPNWVGKRLDE